MGWFYGYETRKQLTDDLLKVTNTGYKMIAKACTSNRLWVVYENPEGYRYITLFLLSKRDGNYGYKPMDEHMGPYYYDCPLKLLEIAEPQQPHTMGKFWRNNVRTYWDDKNKAISLKLKVGQPVLVYNKEYTYSRDLTLNFVVVMNSEGRMFKVRKTDIQIPEVQETKLDFCI